MLPAMLINTGTMFRSGFWLTLLAVTALAIWPDSEPVVTTGWDKANHVVAFFVLMALLDSGWPKLALWGDKFRILLGYGLLLECMQGFTPERFFSLLDLLADVIGILLFIAVRKLHAQFIGSASEQ